MHNAQLHESNKYLNINNITNLIQYIIHIAVDCAL